MNNNTNPTNNRKEQKTNAVTNTTSMAVLVAPGLAVAVAMAAVLWSGGAGLAPTTSPGPGPDQARAKAIRGALAVIEKQLAAHGGTWEKWAEDLKPYRDDIRGVTALKWPWPAKNGYVFQGRFVQMLSSYRRWRARKP